MQQEESLVIEITEAFRRFRWKSELKLVGNDWKKQSGISHGNYLNGSIQLPPNLVYHSRYKLDLCLVPSMHSNPHVFKVHPYLLHLTHPKTFQPLTVISKESWRLSLDVDITERGITVYHRESLICHASSENSIELGSKYLAITIVKPLLNKSSGEVNIKDVIEDRLVHEQMDDVNALEKAELLAKSYKQSGIELPRCRLKATLSYMGLKIGEGLSDVDILDSGDKNVGNFSVDKLSLPHHFCTKGGWRSIMTSKYTCSTQRKRELQVFPAFVVETENNEIMLAEEYFANLGIQFEPIKQIDSLGKRFEFEIPGQNDEEFKLFLQLKLDTPLFITLKRIADSKKTFADGKVLFKYSIHQNENCICQLLMDDFSAAASAASISLDSDETVDQQLLDELDDQLAMHETSSKSSRKRKKLATSNANLYQMYCLSNK